MPAGDTLAEKRSTRRADFHFFIGAIVYPRGRGRPCWPREREGERERLIDAQKIRLTHLAGTARIPTRNITLTNDFRRCVKRSHCSAAEVGRWAGNAPLGRSHFRCREWQSVFVNTNYHAPARSRSYYIELSENSSESESAKFSPLHRFIRASALSVQAGQSASARNELCNSNFHGHSLSF